ncbi:hypothetical protein V8C37DRAFT_88647 [Trichoderma ceciliae]
MLFSYTLFWWHNRTLGIWGGFFFAGVTLTASIENRRQHTLYLLKSWGDCQKHGRPFSCPESWMPMVPFCTDNPWPMRKSDSLSLTQYLAA